MRQVLLFPGALGDLVLLAPAVTAVARTSRVALSVQRSVTPVAAGLLRVSLGPPADGAAMSSLFGPGAIEPSLAAWLEGTDVVHSWFGLSRSGLEGGLARAGISQLHCHAVHRDDGPEHVGLAYAADLGVREPLSPLRLELPAATPPVWSTDSGRRLVMHSGAGSPAKRWPVDRAIALADAWRKRGGEVTILCGPAEEDLVPRWRATAHPIVADVDLQGAASLFASAPLYIGCDSGVTHLAGALARDGVVLFGPTSPTRWAPLGGRLRALSLDTPVADIASILAAMTPPGCLDTPPNQH